MSQLLKMACFLLIGKFFSMSLFAQTSYESDVLGTDFVHASIQQANDYEGKVTCTLVKKVGLDTAKRAVLYVHGFNDYFFQTAMANEFHQNGIRFYAVDLRKYGRSYLPNQKFNNVRDLSEYFADLDTVLRIMESEGCQDVLLSGHSTGGLITAYYAQERKNSSLFDALFLNSPFFDMNQSKFVEKWLLPYAIKKGEKKPDKKVKGSFSEFYGWSLHRSEKGEWDYNLGWKPHKAPDVNYGWIRAICLAQQQAQKGFIIDKPVLVMHSNQSIYSKYWSDKFFEGDAVLSVKDIYDSAKAIQGDCTITTIQNGMHDLILSRKPVRELVYTQLFDWINKKMRN